MIPQRLANYFIRYYSKYNMRDSYRFINPFAKNNSKKCNITNNGHICWNNLPMSLISMYSINTLKQCCIKINYIIGYTDFIL